MKRGTVLIEDSLWFNVNEEIKTAKNISNVVVALKIINVIIITFNIYICAL